jgi:hypothetical protein
MNEVDAGRDRATPASVDMVMASLSPLSLHATREDERSTHELGGRN